MQLLLLCFCSCLLCESRRCLRLCVNCSQAEPTRQLTSRLSTANGPRKRNCNSNCFNAETQRTNRWDGFPFLLFKAFGDISTASSLYGRTNKTVKQLPPTFPVFRILAS